MSISYKVFYSTVAQKERFPQYLQLPIRRMCWCLYQMADGKPARLVYTEPEESGDATLSNELQPLVVELNLLCSHLNSKEKTNVEV